MRISLATHIKRKTFTAGSHYISRLYLSHGLFEHLIEFIVAMTGVVMKRHELFYIRQGGKLKGMPDTAVAEADPILVFLM